MACVQMSTVDVQRLYDDCTLSFKIATDGELRRKGDAVRRVIDVQIVPALFNCCHALPEVTYLTIASRLWQNPGVPSLLGLMHR